MLAMAIMFWSPTADPRRWWESHKGILYVILKECYHNNKEIEGWFGLPNETQAISLCFIQRNNFNIHRGILQHLNSSHPYLNLFEYSTLINHKDSGHCQNQQPSCQAFFSPGKPFFLSHPVPSFWDLNKFIFILFNNLY